MYKCVLCENNVRKFLPGGRGERVLDNLNVVGGGYRRNCICPYCHSKDRDRAIWLFLKEQSDFLTKELSVLHISPAEALSNKINLLNNIDYLPTDFTGMRSGIKVDITNTPFPADFFDIILCNHVLEHVSDDIVAMKEIYRILKPGGWALLQVPIAQDINETYEDLSVIDQEQRLNKFGQKDHVRIYGIDYEDRLRLSGFIVNKFSFLEVYGEQYTKKYALIKDEIIYQCLKK